MRNYLPNRKVILSVQGVDKVYHKEIVETDALKGIDLDIYQGEMVAIMGASGSGKSTLLNIIGALDSPTKGTIALDGVVADRFHQEPYATKYRSEHIGFVFQNYNLLKDLTVEDNVALPLILQGREKREIVKTAAEMIALVGLSKWKKQRPIELSGGQQQRVAIARALVAAPSLLLADEPTGNLDYNTTREIMDIIQKMNQELNQTILIVTHDPGVAAYADRIVYLHNGSIANMYVKDGEKGNLNDILDIFQTVLEG